MKVTASSGADGRLYGAVTSKDIVEALEADFGIKLDKKKLNLSDPIKAHGSFSIEVKLYAEIRGTFTVVVHE